MFIRFALFFVVAIVAMQAHGQATFTPQQQASFGRLTDFKGSDLCEVAKASNDYLLSHPDDNEAVHDGSIIGNGITLEQVKATLDFICQTYQEDVRAGRQSRLHNSEFINQHFTLIRWSPDKLAADKIAASSTNDVKTRLLSNIPEDKLFLTKYYTKLLTASNVKTEEFSQALYELPYDEQGMSLEQAEQRKASLTRFNYTRQQIIDGVLTEKKLAKPLVWLSEEALHDVLLQGTGVLMVDGKVRYFNVHRNNGIAYNYSIGKREQARYWYFAEVPSILGYGKEIEEKITIKPQVTLAGNVKQLGLGKLMLLSYTVNQEQRARLAILADKGGAFDNNLFQLDLLVDSYLGWQDYYQANKHLPDYANVWILVKKETKQ